MECAVEVSETMILLLGEKELICEQGLQCFFSELWERFLCVSFVGSLEIAGIPLYFYLYVFFFWGEACDFDVHVMFCYIIHKP